VAKGGHNIPEDVVRRRYRKGLKNFVDLFMPLCDEWMVADNSANIPEPIAEGILQTIVKIYRPEAWKNILEYGTKK
jgi:predicted ABC-type ATPase